MSKLSDYSKFDHIDSDVDDDEGSDHCTGPSDERYHPHKQGAPPPRPPHAAASPSSPPASAGPMKVTGTTRKKASQEGRYVFEVDGRTIYEWEQSLEEVNIYIDAPPNVRAAQIVCDILPDRLRLGLRGSDRYFLDEMTYGKVVVSDSSWCLDDEGAINIILAKARRGEMWEGVLTGATTGESVDPFVKEEMKKDLMLERFQEENPGFDFRGATFNGQAPDPRTFMGGVQYS